MPKMPLPRRPFFQEAEAGEELEGARLLPLDVIDANPQQARQVFDEQSLAELADSIREHGVLEPILVRSLDGRYQVVAGERRTRAARQVGLTDIPAIIRDMSDEEAAYVTAIENLHRADLDIEDEARWLAYLQELTNLSDRQLAGRLGKGRMWVNRRLRLVREGAHLFARIREGKLTIDGALLLLGGDAEEDLSRDVTSTTDGSVESVSRRVTPTERAALDIMSGFTRLTPTPYRARALTSATTTFLRMDTATVPPAERATVRAHLELVRQRLDEMLANLGE